MKTTKEKRADLIRLINGDKSLAEISLESVSTLHIRGNVDTPEYWIGSLKVEESEFTQAFNWLNKHAPGVIIDWSTRDKLDILIPVAFTSSPSDAKKRDI